MELKLFKMERKEEHHRKIHEFFQKKRQELREQGWGANDNLLICISELFDENQKLNKEYWPKQMFCIGDREYWHMLLSAIRDTKFFAEGWNLK